MYTRCHLCRRSLGSNAVLRHMPVGKRLAFDPDRGRLWVVCRRCGEWNLTPMEIRWEAVEECGRLFEGAEARASARGVGVAKLRGLELIRLGDALPDEIANWRYGRRLARRTLQRRILYTTLGVMGGLMIGGMYLAGVAAGSYYVAMYFAVVGAFYAWRMRQSVGPQFAMRFTDDRGVSVRVPKWLVERIFINAPRRTRRHPASLRVGVFLDTPREEAKGRARSHFHPSEPDLWYADDAALPVLRAALTRLNWDGATAPVIQAAVLAVGKSEERAAAKAGPDADAPWRFLVRAGGCDREWLASMDPVRRLALEMAVTEAIERRALAGEAARLEDESTGASEVAHIADNLFVPDRITDWIRRQKQAEERPSPIGARHATVAAETLDERDVRRLR